MTAKAESSNPTGYLVFNPDTDGYKVFPNEATAYALCDQRPSLRVFPMWGTVDVDEKLLGLIRWAVAA